MLEKSKTTDPYWLSPHTGINWGKYDACCWGFLVFVFVCLFLFVFVCLFVCLFVFFFCCIFISEVYMKWKTNKSPLVTSPPMPRLLRKFKYWNYSKLTLVKNVEKGYHTYYLSFLDVIRKPQISQIQRIKRGITLVKIVENCNAHEVKLLTLH